MGAGAVEPGAVEPSAAESGAAESGAVERRADRTSTATRIAVAARNPDAQPNALSAPRMKA